MKTAPHRVLPTLESGDCKRQTRNRVLSGSKKRLAILLLILGSALLFRAFTFPTRIVGASMEPTLRSGQYYLMKSCWSHTTPLRRYEVVAVRIGGELITKRIIGLPNELVRMEQGVVFIDGKPVDEPFPVQRGEWTIKPGLVEPNKYLLMGDNRDRPEHSFFLVPREAIVGRQF
jgi:signal peptidase I